MATIAEPGDQRGVRRAGSRSRFYVWQASACAAVAILGFAPTYWLQLPGRTFVGPPLLHIHGALCTAWVLFLISQAWLVSQGRLRNHRDWGLAGVALAAAIVVVGYVTAIVGLEERLARGEGDAARAFLITPVAAMTLFAVFTGWAIASTHRPEWHKRLMIAGTVSLVEAAGARVAFTMFVGQGPGIRPGRMPLPPELMPTFVGLLLQGIVIAGMVRDKRVTGSIHPAWIVAFTLSAAILVLKVPVSHTAMWLAFADWTTGIGG